LLEGLTPPRASLHLAQGTRTPERFSASFEAALDPRRCTYSPDQSIKCPGTSREPRSKANPRHAGPLTPPGNHIPTLFHQPALCGHPRRCAGAMREGRCHSMTLCHPLPYLFHAALSKEVGGTLERGTTTCPAPARDGAVTSGQQSASPQSPPALCDQPRHRAAIPDASTSSPALWEPRSTGHRHADRCAASGLPSAEPSNQRTDGNQTRSSHATTLEAAPGRAQDSPRRLPEARFARTTINSTTLCAMPPYVALRALRHDCKPPPLGL
jgi:hypothetical protein